MSVSKPPCSGGPDGGERSISLRVGAIADHRGMLHGAHLMRLVFSTDGAVAIDDLQPDRAGIAVDVDRPDAIAVPAFVNAHAHLDLTEIGPQPFDPVAGFDAWLEMVIGARPTTSQHIRGAVEKGVELSRAGGVAAVGDIAGATRGEPNLAAAEALADSGMLGASFIEFFSLGTLEEDRLQEMKARWQEHRRSYLPRSGFHIGLQPHAPYSVSPSGYSEAARLCGESEAPLATHVAESLAESAFIAKAEGPMRSFLERRGLWTSQTAIGVGDGATPIQHVIDAICVAPPPVRILLVHASHLTDADIDRIASAGVSVVYCPRSATYFAHDVDCGPHRYRELLEAGVNVCLGTDSIINLDTPDRISPFDDARVLRRRDRIDGLTLLAMLTMHGAKALGLEQSLFELESGRTSAGVVLLATCGDTGEKAPKDLLDQAFENDAPPVLVKSDSTRGSTRMHA